jgi:hypothetical protein
LSRKKPIHKIEVKKQKKPNIYPSASPDKFVEKTLVWKFCFLDFEGQWSWFNLNSKEEITKLKAKLKDFETMTWGQLKQNRKNSRCHPIPKNKLCQDAQKRLRDLKLDDIDELHELVLGGPKRIWGIKHYESICILWWDPEHTVYPVGKKHT